MTAPQTPPSPPVAERARGTLVRVRANQPTFREVEFFAGFNVILAERTHEATKKDSRNGVGKSTLVEIISFCLGAGVKAGKGLLNTALADWAFTLDLTLAGRFVSATRHTADHKKIYIDGDTSGWPLQPSRERGTGQAFFKVGDWTSALGDAAVRPPARGVRAAVLPLVPEPGFVLHPPGQGRLFGPVRTLPETEGVGQASQQRLPARPGLGGRERLAEA